MGLLRLLLALSVVVAHASPIFGWFGIQGYTAVHAFFIISGFYMALILNEKYVKKNNSYSLFITNRILRIYPIYLIMTVIVFSFTLIKFFMGSPGPENITYHFVLYFSQHHLGISLFELINFLFRNITLIVTSDYWRAPQITPTLLLSPAWTLQIEMLFYLIAPFVVRKSAKIFLAICIIYVIGLFYFVQPESAKPSIFSLDFFIFSHFFYFFLGVWSYKLYRIIKKRHITAYVSTSAFILVLCYTFFFQTITPLIHIPNIASEVPYYLFVTLLLPFVFLYGRTFSFDRFLGELSYPVYISHIFFVKVFYNVPWMHQQSPLSSMLVVATTLLTSWALMKYVDTAIDTYRQSRLK